jgi:hypothetical protein
MLFLPARADAQDTASVACAGQRISSIVINPAAPTVALLRRAPILARAAAAVHTTTRAEVIRRFLLLSEGQPCDERRRAESERILRAQPYIAEALVRALPNGDGTVDLDVWTSDEVALVFGLAGSTHQEPLRFVRIGDANLNGEGIYVAADWRAGLQFRDGFGARFVDNQLFGTPYTLALDGHQTPLGEDRNAAFTYPFYTDLQHVAWRARVGANDDYVQYQNDQNSSHAIRLTRSYFDAGGIARIGAPGRLILLGASISGDDEKPGVGQVLITSTGFAADTSRALVGRFAEHRIARVNALAGIRDIGFATVRGYDALTGTQDLPYGLEVGTLFGRSVSALGSRDNDLFVATDLYAGAIGHNNALRLQVQAEGRNDYDAGLWDGILVSSRAVEYVKLRQDHTATLSLEYSGGWRQRIPFNLSLSDPEGGLRGFSSSNTPGGQRAVARFDNRMFMGRPFNAADVGVGVFTDVGRLWRGDIPYGVTTPWRSSAGISLLAAVPPHSARVWRVDLAYAIRPEPGGHRMELRLTNTDKTTFFLAEPSDISATRERTVPSSVFRWPQ